MVRPQDYSEIPENRHQVRAGALLFPTDTAIAGTQTTSFDFVREQGGDETTFIFVFGLREARGPFGMPVEFVEGVFLSEEGPGFRPTWGVEQLMNEIDMGGWTVVRTDEVVARWAPRVEERMNRGTIV